MFVFAYEARQAEAFARAHAAAVAQAGSGSAPYEGTVADAVAQDRRRETVPNGTENPEPAPSTPRKARKKAPAATKEASHV